MIFLKMCVCVCGGIKPMNYDASVNIDTEMTNPVHTKYAVARFFYTNKMPGKCRSVFYH